MSAPQPAPAAGTTPTEIITVQSRVVACDGGNGALGHPRVWLRIQAQDVQCPYCSRLYVIENEAIDRGH